MSGLKLIWNSMIPDNFIAVERRALNRKSDSITFCCRICAEMFFGAWTEDRFKAHKTECVKKYIETKRAKNK